VLSTLLRGFLTKRVDFASELSGLILAAGAQAALPPVLPLDFIGDKRLLWHHVRGPHAEPFVCGHLLLRDFAADESVDHNDRRGPQKAFAGYAGELADKFHDVSDADMAAIVSDGAERKQHRLPGGCVWVSSRLALGFIANRCSADIFDQALAILRPAHGAAGGGGAGVMGAVPAGLGGAGGAPAAAAVAAAPPAPAARRRPLQLLQVWRLLTVVGKRKQLQALISAIKQSRAATDIALRKSLQQRLDTKREPNISSAALAGHADAARHHNARSALIWAAVAKIVARRRDATAPQTPRTILTPVTPAPLAAARAGAGAGAADRADALRAGLASMQAAAAAEQNERLELKGGGDVHIDRKEGKGAVAAGGAAGVPDAAPVAAARAVGAAFEPSPCLVAPLCLVPRTFQVRVRPRALHCHCSLAYRALVRIRG